MRRKKGYLLQKICGVYYLLPYGQLIADLTRGVSLNDSGAFVWKLLEKDMSREEILAEYLRHFSENTSQTEKLIDDLNGFLKAMTEYGCIEDDASPRKNAGGNCVYLNIGGLNMALYCPDELIRSTYLWEFRSERPEKADLCVSVSDGAPDISEKGEAILRNIELDVYDRETEYLLIFPTLSKINGAELSKDGSNAYVYCDDPSSEETGEQFFHVLRHIFLYLAGRRRLFAIHSASVLYRGKAWLFSASSGTGKSTHTNLWKKLYGTKILNGDLNLLTVSDGKPEIRGIPWCGTSEIFSKETVPLGGIILLKQAKEDFLTELSEDKKILHILHRFICPMWTPAQLSDGVDFAGELVKKIAVCQLNCTKNDSAAELAKSWIDDRL